MLPNLRTVESLPSRMLSKTETAEILNISISGLDRLMKAGEINYIRVGLRRIGFQRSDIQEYQARNSAQSDRNRTHKNGTALAA